MDADGEDPATAPWTVWCGLIAIAAISFWSQAVVTEERFVPALNVIATEFNIPDDIAGATLMAAGASSPELFSSIVALFITHSALGLGTIVGSEIFNQLVICAGAVWASKSGTLQLDKAIVIREVGFYALAIVLLYYALRDQEPSDDDETGEQHIFIEFSDAAILFGGYIAYVLVCANFVAIVACFSRGSGNVASSEGRSRRTDIDIPDMPFLRGGNFDREPEANFKLQTFQVRPGGQMRASTSVEPGEEAALIGGGRGKNHRASFFGKFSDGATLRAFSFLVEADKPSDQHELHDLAVNTFDEHLSCFLWQRSYFYNKSKFAINGWNLRWFTLTRDSIYSVPDRADYIRHRITYPKFKEVEVDDVRLILKLVHPTSNKRHFYLMAPDKLILDAVLKKLEDIMEVQEEATKSSLATKDDDEVTVAGEFESGESLLTFPADGTLLEILLHFILFPFKFAMQYSIPDVRQLDEKGSPVGGIWWAFLAAISCLAWLIVGSYAMVASLEALADLLSIPDAVVGVTVSAAGTSLPNYVASKVAAEKGFGNMAVSNAFGSNTFNIMVGLGLPWLLYISIANGFQPYHGLKNEGILESVIVMLVVLLIFVVILLMSGFKLYQWHGNLFIVLYIGYLLFAILPVYL